MIKLFLRSNLKVPTSIYSTTQPIEMFKSLAESSTWNTNEGEKTEDSKRNESNSSDCELEADYDIPKNRESLQTLVKNLSFIVSKLKKQIQKLDENNSTSTIDMSQDIFESSTEKAPLTKSE